MKTWEALKAMEEGKKVYRRGWRNKSKYWFMSGQEMFNNELIRASIDNCYFDDWEIYEEEKVYNEFFSRKDGLNTKEGLIMDNLVNAWNEFIKLEKQHPSEVNDFADAIHKAQRILGLRVLRRDYPDGWIKNKVE